MKLEKSMELRETLKVALNDSKWVEMKKLLNAYTGLGVSPYEGKEKEEEEEEEEEM